MRLLGILTGSAIALALLIVTIGVPELSPLPEAKSPQPDRKWLPQSLPLPAEPETQIASEASDAPAEPDTQVASETFDAPAEPVTQVATEALDASAEPAPGGSPGGPEKAGQATLTEPKNSLQGLPPTADANWYAFWSPFRSEIAADGFITELQRTTGLDYRVVRLKPGVYEVAFAYSDKNDIQEKLARISTATGLDMSGG